MKPIFLTGFMGSGKSTVGRALAAQLGRSFLDADAFFAQETGLEPTFYIKRFGIDPFRKSEKIFLRKILANPPGILSTGGGAVIDPLNRSLLMQKGFVVWIYSPLPQVLARLNHRPLPPMLTKPITLENLQKLFDFRKPFYQKCHLKVTNHFKNPQEVAKEIVEVYATI
ncbi:MAG: shikimate kinase [Deltaproteobacteria bacterium]|nr:shikimate kinase [Deltaproteobacteria bacterium]